MMSLIAQAKGAASSAAAAIESAEQLRQRAEGGGGGIQEEEGAPAAVEVPVVADPCTECGKLGATVRCPCRANTYCGQKCYKKHWKVGDHQKQCRFTLARELNVRALHCAREAHTLYCSLGPEHAADAQKAMTMIGMLEGVLSVPSGAASGWPSLADL